MSQPGGRGLGRAGRGLAPKKGAEASKSTTVTPSGRSGRFGSVPVKPSTSKSQAGESRAEFPKPMEIEESITETATAARLGGDGNGQGDDAGGKAAAVGRGAFRGRRQIKVADVLRTKPDSCSCKKGNFGTELQLMTNYFRLETVTDWALYQYRVDFNVEEDRESVLRGWLREHKDELKTAYIFDGTMLFTSQSLTVKNQPLTLTSIRESDKFRVQIDIKLVQVLKNGNAVYFQVFNILVRRCLLHLNLYLVNRNYFDPEASVRLPQHHLEIWPGYETAIRQYDGGIFMCCEIAHKVMRTDTALNLLAECTNESGDYKKLFQQSVIGAIVLTDYNNRTYRIDDVDFSLNPMSTFKYKNNEDITYVEYYRRRYQIKINDLRQPLLVSKASDRDQKTESDRQCLLVPELCRMTGLTSRMLDNRYLMKDLSEVTRLPPGVRIQRLKAFNDRLQREKQVVDDLEQWGMKLSKNLTVVTGREFPSEQLAGGESATYWTGEEVDWTRSMRSCSMLRAPKFESFVVIYPSRLKTETENFLLCLKKAANGMKYWIPKPFLVETRTDNPREMLAAVEDVAGKHNPDMIMFGFTTDRADRYCALKRKCYVDRGIPNQVVLGKSMTAKGVMSIATKVAIQINCKMGGAPWSVRIPTDNIMVVGYDVCHDKKRNARSVGAVVASLNKEMSAWYSTVSHHPNKEEICDLLPQSIFKAIKKYRDHNSNTLPTRIVVYRDGVGEGQLEQVHNREVGVLKKMLTDLYGNDSWKLAYIIVTKRISTRFFNNGMNPKPGTIVDDVITLPNKYDFFLVSQSVRQGTVSPTNYNVISDNLGWTPNHVQRLTYKMTHLYYNCSATVRVPAPCQYAHKLAFMVSQNLQGEPHPSLSTRLYFL